MTAGCSRPAAARMSRGCAACRTAAAWFVACGGKASRSFDQRRPSRDLLRAHIAETDLWARGCAWLGRDPESGAALEPPSGARTWLGDAVRRGHPGPRALRVSCHPQATDEAVRTAYAAARLRRRECGPVGRESHASPFSVRLVTSACSDDSWRCSPASRGRRAAARDPGRRLRARLRCVSPKAASDPDELARRDHPGLTARQSRWLREWGYPYVLDQYRFHVTLSGPIESDGGTS